MRGTSLLLGYLIGNKEARKWCIKKLCQASCFVDQEIKKTPLGKMLLPEKKGNENVQKTDETKS